MGLVIAVGVLPASDPAPPGRPARSSRRYDDSFRRYAVKRALEPDVRVADVAGELGVSASTLRRWVKAAEGVDTGDAGDTETRRDAAGETSRDASLSLDGPDPSVSTPSPASPVGPVSQVSVDDPADPAGSASLSGEVSLASEAGEVSLSGEAGPVRAAPTVVPANLVSAAGPTPATASEHDAPHVIAMLDAILEMFPHPARLPLEADLTDPGPGARREAEPVADRIPLHPGDDIFPRLSTLLPAYRFPIILAGLLAALLVSTVVPADYALRPLALSLHVLSLVVSFGAVLVIDWHGLLWLAGRRGLTESTRLAAGAGPLIWGGLAGLMATGALLHPDLSSPLTLTKMVLVLAVAWNGAAMSALRRRMAQLPAYVKPADLPRRDWRLMMTATVISQVGWWGAILIGFVNSST
ncbi:transposase [Humibacillus xanthopallidus]|uniref:transposase n=1 Tax=Humibacillus xanthopallidus TaxID=412689 RepID=UPI00385110D9